MGEQPRKNRDKTAVSMLILASLAAIAALVLIKQAHFDIAAFGIVQEKLPAAGPPEAENPARDGFEKFLPQGYSPAGVTEQYSASNLYEKINGKAPQYTESGFEALTTQMFVSDANDQLGMEVYLFDMGNARNAFSVYSVQRRAGTVTAEGFQFAYRTENSFYFAHGRYYVEMVGWAASGHLLETMQTMAANMTAELEGARIDEIETLPAENMVPGSIKLYVANAFGCEDLEQIFVARYQVDSQQITAFIKKCDSAVQAQQQAQNYKNFLTNNGVEEKQALNDPLAGNVLDVFGYVEIVTAAGPYLAGIHEAEDQTKAEQLMLNILYQLEETNDR